jgi:membrane-bound ClpP family serine protease
MYLSEYAVDLQDAFAKYIPGPNIKCLILLLGNIKLFVNILCTY